MDKVDVICVLKKGPGYTEQQVKRLYRQVQDKLTLPHRFVCLSDVPIEFCDVNFKMEYAFTGKWSKIEIFRPDLPLNNEILYFDLDTILLENIDCFFAGEDFVLRKPSIDYKTRITQEGKKKIRRYSSSIMNFKKNSRPEIWENFDQKIMDRFHFDQDYIGHIIPKEKTFPEKWATKFYPEFHKKRPKYKVVCFCGQNKSYTSNYKWIKDVHEKYSS